MGLSASQARFLQLTARKSNIEYEVQQISFERLQLANKMSDASTKYQDATNNRHLVFSCNTGIDKLKIDLTYTNYKNYMNKQMEGFDSTLNEYYLVTSSGNLIVVANEAERDKMIQDNTKKTPISDINNAKDIVSGEKFKQEFSQLLETSLGANESEKKEKLITLLSDSLNALSKETEKSKKDEIKKTYINKLNEILGTPKDDEDENIKKIREKFSDSLSGFSSVSDDTKKLANTDLSKKTIISEDGIEYILECPFEKEDFFIADNHNVDLNDTDGFQRAIQEGTFFFARFKENSVTGEQELRTEGWDVLGGGAISSELDKTDDAAAEAEYKAVTDRIQAIDKKLELRIDQLETERDAVQTEMDSVSKTLEDNIERSFKVFG